MGVADAVMGATKPGLEVPEDTMDARQNLGRPARVALRVRSWPVTLVRGGVVAPPAVSDHDRSRSHVRSHEAGQRPGRDVRNHFEAYPSGSLAPDLYRAHNDRLVNNVAPATQARFWPADVGFIYLDLALERLPLRAHHGATKLLQHGPSRLGPAGPQPPVGVEGPRSPGSGARQVGGPEPLRQRNPGSVEHSPGRD